MPHLVHVLSVPESLVFLRGQVAFLRRRGWEMTVVTSPGPALEAFGRENDVAVRAIDLPRRIAPREDATSLVRMTSLLRRLRPDLVHTSTPKGGLLGTVGAAIARVPVRLYHLRGMLMLTATGVQRRILSAVERTTCRASTHMIANSHSLREWAIEHKLCPPSKIRVLGSGSGNGVDCDTRFSPENVPTSRRSEFRAKLGLPPNTPVVGFLGRLVRDKGIIELANAWRKIATDRPDAHLVLGGVFEERDAIPVETRAALEQHPRVHLIGFVEDPPAFYAGIDVLVLPTHREGFPNVLLEGAAMRVPIVATQVMGALDAVIDGLTGLLVPLNNDVALARAVIRYLDDPDLRSRHGSAGRERVLREFRPEQVWTALADYYDEIVINNTR